MHAKTLVPDAKHLRCDGVQWNGSQVMIRGSCVSVTATCPTCGHVSNRVHSRYERRLQDLPWQWNAPNFCTRGYESMGWVNETAVCCWSEG